ncbi:MAG: hypothetical protein V2A76_00005, partial [Planctomycetota bacterium]
LSVFRRRSTRRTSLAGSAHSGIVAAGKAARGPHPGVEQIEPDSVRSQTSIFWHPLTWFGA